jgi:acyl-CoA synthetase (AMP-forming)/AMP-acid ligase II
LNPNYKKDEFDFYFGDLKAKAVVVPRGTHEKRDGPLVLSSKDNGVLLVETWWSPLRQRVEYAVFGHRSNTPLYESERYPIFVNFSTRFPGIAKPDDVAMILHTSGTTGRPKTVPLTHANISRSMINIVNTYHLTADDRTYIVMPLFHVHGLIGALLSTLNSGGSAIIPPKFSAHNFWNDFIGNNATWYSAVPTIHSILLNTPPPKQLPKIRFVRSCSAALAPATFHQLEEFMKAPVLEAYAMTEASHQMCSNPYPPLQRKPGTVGPGQGVEVVILDDEGHVLKQGSIGEVSIRGANVTKGYANNAKANSESFTKQGYFRTGDQGFLDEDGYLNLTGRLKELINRGGEKISPLELDAVMLSHPNVKECVAFGVSDAHYGQIVHAAVVTKGKLTSEKLTEFMKKKVASFKVPVKFYFVDQLPKTATGKIQRRKMEEIFLTKSKL